jgi:two-component sensor histidine kinase
MGYRIREREFPLRSAKRNNNRAQQRHLLTESAEASSARSDAKEQNWIGYASSLATPASVRSGIAGGHFSFGLAPTLAETLREPFALLQQRSIAREFNQRLAHKDVLLREQAHRFANSLQIIAGTLLTKSRSVQSEEARKELQTAHHRILSLAAMRQDLQASTNGDRIDLQSCLSGLCEALTDSMICDEGPITLRAHVDAGPVDADLAVSIYRIATELIINALKHAFPESQTGCAVTVTFEQAGPNWKLAVSDNGAGKAKRTPDKSTAGLGTKIVGSLAKHLDAIVEITKGTSGRAVSIIHGTVVARQNMAEPLIPA